MATSTPLYCAVTGTSSQEISVTIDQSYSQISTVATVECDSTTLSMGDAIEIDMGYVSNHAVLFRGYVKKIEYSRPDFITRITAYDTLVRATDYFIASENPDDPLAFYNISSLSLIQQLLGVCGISNVVGTEPGFTWGTNEEGAKFNLQTVADAVQFVSSTVGYTLYDDGTGQIHFVQRYPYATASDTPTMSFITGNSGQILTCQYIKSTEKTRNRIVVYGKSPLRSSIRADNSNLVVDQTAVIAHPLLDTQEICDGTALVNLQILNVLTQSFEVEVEGDPAILPRTIATITDSYSGASNRKIFLYRVSHSLSSQGGYITSFTGIP